MNSKTLANTSTWTLLAALLLGAAAKPAQAGSEEVAAAILLGTALVVAAREGRDDEYYQPGPTHPIKRRRHENHRHCDHVGYAHPSARGKAWGRQFAPGHVRHGHRPAMGGYRY